MLPLRYIFFMLLQVMTELRHPNIVQFLGLCFLEGSTLPVLVMERLDSSLDDLLETSPGLPLALKLSLLTDVFYFIFFFILYKHFMLQSNGYNSS